MKLKKRVLANLRKALTKDYCAHPLSPEGDSERMYTEAWPRASAALSACPFCAAVGADMCIHVRYSEALGFAFNVKCEACGTLGPFASTCPTAVHLWNWRTIQ